MIGSGHPGIAGIAGTGWQLVGELLFAGTELDLAGNDELQAGSMTKAEEGGGEP